MDGLMRSMMGLDGGLAKRVKVGDRVRHYNTEQWGVVLRVVQQSDGTAELLVEREPGTGFCGFTGQGWWATYHIDDIQPAKEVTP